MEVSLPHGGPGFDIDERPRFVEEWLDLAPLAHERFKLVERVECLVPAEDHHAGATAPDAVDLSAVLLDMAVPGDCHCCCVVCGIQLT